MASTNFTVVVAPSEGDYAGLNTAVQALKADYTAATTLVFSITGGITGTMSDNTAVTGLTSGATGTCIHCTSTQILIKSISGTFQSGEICYRTLGVNYVTLGSIGASTNLVISIQGSWSSADTGSVTFASNAAYTLSSSNTATILTTGSAQHNGMYSSTAGFYRLETTQSGTSAMQINSPWLTVDGLLIKGTAGNACISISPGNSTIDGIVVSNCVVEKSDTTAANILFISATGGSAAFYNSVFVATLGNNDIVVKMTLVTGTVNLYNCITIARGTVSEAINLVSGVATYTNCYAFNNSAGAGTGLCYQSGSANITIVACAAADTSGSSGLKSIGFNNSTFVSTATGAENFMLATGSPLITAGTNLFSIFTTDIAGSTRQSTSSWDVGVFVYGTASSAAQYAFMTPNQGYWGGIT